MYHYVRLPLANKPFVKQKKPGQDLWILLCYGLTCYYIFCMSYFVCFSAIESYSILRSCKQQNDFCWCFSNKIWKENKARTNSLDCLFKWTKYFNVLTMIIDEQKETKPCQNFTHTQDTHYVIVFITSKITH